MWSLARGEQRFQFLVAAVIDSFKIDPRAGDAVYWQFTKAKGKFGLKFEHN